MTELFHRYSGRCASFVDISLLVKDCILLKTESDSEKRKEKGEDTLNRDPIHIMGLCSLLAYQPAPGPNLASPLLEGPND